MRTQVLLAEYTWVAGLIRYYREVELKALGATGVLLSAVAATYAALEGADARAREAEGMFLAAAAWVPAFIVPIILMASMRGMRAVFYVREWLQPLAAELARDERYLAWELVSQKVFVACGGRSATGPTGRLISAAPVLLLVAAASIALAVGAWTIHPTDASRAIGTGAALFAAGFAVFGLKRADASAHPNPLSAECRKEILEGLY